MASGFTTTLREIEERLGKLEHIHNQHVERTSIDHDLLYTLHMNCIEERVIRKKIGLSLSGLLKRNKKRNAKYKITFRHFLNHLDALDYRIDAEEKFTTNLNNKINDALPKFKSLEQSVRDYDENFSLLEKSLSHIDDIKELNDVLIKIDKKYKLASSSIKEEEKFILMNLANEWDQYKKRMRSFRESDKAVKRLASVEKRITLIELKENKSIQTDEIAPRLE
jgi:hypothetical protein